MEVDGKEFQKGSIIFKLSLEEILETEKSRAIKGILSTLDALITNNDAKKNALRKAVLDHVNDLARTSVSLLNSIAKRK